MSVTRFRPANGPGPALACLISALFQGCFPSLGGENEKSPDQAFSGSYRFEAPAASARLDLDSIYPIRWSAGDAAGSGAVRLSVYRKGAFLGDLSASLPAQGGYAWNLPASRSLGGYRLGSGTGYRLRLANVADSTRQAFSDSFTVLSRYSGSLALIAPAEGFRTRIDSALTVSWSSAGDIGGEVGLQLFKDTALVKTFAAPVPAASGTYVWPAAEAPAGPGDDYRIRVFSIADPSIERTGPIFGLAYPLSGSFAFLRPAEGDTVMADSVIRIEWTVTGNPGPLSFITLWRDAPRDSLAGYTPLDPATTSIEWRAPAGLASGAYRFRISGYPDPRVSAFSPAFHIRGEDPDGYENDDDRAAAKPIATDGAPQPRNLTSGDVDWIRFDAGPGKFYRLALAADTALELDLEDGAGSRLVQQSGAEMHFVLSPGHPGPYYLKIYAASPAIRAAYRLAVWEYDSSAAYKAGFSAPDSNTVWKAGSDQRIAWTPDTAVFGSTIALLLLNDTAFVATLGNYLGNTGSFAWSLPYDLPTGNRYRIRISSMASGIIAASGPAFSISGLPPDAYEPDDTRETAGSIRGNGPVQQRNILAGEADWCGFVAMAGMHYTATVESFALSTALSLRDSAGNAVAADTAANPSLTYEAQYNGGYYLVIQGLAGAGNYSLKLSNPP